MGRTVPLHQIAHARTGDKGEVTNMSVFPHDDDDYELLRAHVTAAAVKDHFGHLVSGEVVRYEVPTICGLNFLLHGTRPGGVAAALQLDTHGKALAYGLLTMQVPVEDRPSPAESGERSRGQMARLPYPDIAEEPRATIAARVVATRGTLLNLFRALLHAPTVAAPWLELGTAMRYETGLPLRMRELVICQVARKTGSAYEWHHHAGVALSAGVTEEQLGSLPDWQANGTFDADDRAVLAYFDQVIDGTVRDASFHAVASRLGPEETVELTATAVFYLATSRFLAAVDVQVEDQA